MKSIYILVVNRKMERLFILPSFPEWSGIIAEYVTGAYLHLLLMADDKFKPLAMNIPGKWLKGRETDIHSHGCYLAVRESEREKERERNMIICHMTVVKILLISIICQ